jgi:dTDP-4-dehydrorhamnose reductase
MSDHTIRILVTGGSGFLGYSLCKFLSGRHEVFATYCTNPVTVPGCTFIHTDITDKQLISEAINRISPTIIIHAAAVSSPDACERNPAMASSVNVTGTQNIVHAAEKTGASLVYVSTDLVYDGEKGNYAEHDIPSPLSIYGKTKREAEKICLSASTNVLVVRITLQYGWGNRNTRSFSDWLFGNLQSGKESPLFTDQYRSPAYVFDTAQGLEMAALYGPTHQIYHLSGPDRIDRYSFGVVFASTFGYPDILLKKSFMSDVEAFAPRPVDVSLNGQKFLHDFNFQPGNIHDGLAAMSRETPEV